MKTLYLECGMGAAGDMLMAALLELIPDRQAFLDKMNALGLPGVAVEVEPAVKCGITSTHMKITVHGEEEESVDVHDHEHEHHHDHDHEHDHEHHHEHEHDHDHDHPHDHDHDHEGHHHHHHTSVADIEGIIDGLDVSARVKADAKAVYALIAEAESKVHGHPISEIHFHEVGTLDAVADVVGVCLLMEMIGAEQIVASPVHVGSGYVRCMHGVLPVPAPATALILTGIPTYGGQIKGELCTPTGAALLKHFASSFGDRPMMAVQAIGYGMGKKDFERANCVRAFLGEGENAREPLTRLECNLDDITGEELGFAQEQLMKAGAFDVYTIPIGMKKSRPGILLNVICSPENADQLAQLVMKHTTTLGIRRQDLTRYFLHRYIDTVDTAYGPVRVKRAEGMGVKKQKAEYDDLAALAVKNGVSLKEIRNAVPQE
ncbi:MAG: nickel pincer cofactor biosynthesis protein LarC [Clostridia bacterium]|nr:nickel pincer cofactor biosynthesis protein LarC [Clostridia bacterium]